MLCSVTLENMYFLSKLTETIKCCKNKHLKLSQNLIGKGLLHQLEEDEDNSMFNFFVNCMLMGIMKQINITVSTLCK